MSMDYREMLRGFNYPDSVLNTMTDEECEGEYEVVISDTSNRG